MNGMNGINGMSGRPDALRIWLALLPPAIYLVAIGLLHLRRRPSAVAGGWDSAALAAAVAGAVVVGPLDLLLPTAVAGPWRIAIGCICFALIAVAVQLATRPRLVIYNVTIEQLRPIVAQVAAALDPVARWAGETVALPGRDVQVHLDARGGLRSVSLVTLGSRTSPEGWAEFSRRTRRAVRGLRVRSSPWAALFLSAGLLLGGVAAWMAWTGWTERTSVGAGAAAAMGPTAVKPPSSSAPVHPASIHAASVSTGVPDAGPRRSLGS